MSIGRRSHVAIAIIASVLAASSVSVTADRTAERPLQDVVRRFLQAIYDREYAVILSLIPEEGILDGDTWISKKEIGADIKNPSSALHRQLYQPLSGSFLKTCVDKLGGVANVSPGVFYALHGEEYTVQAKMIDESEGTHFGVKIEAAGQARSVNGCTAQLWHLMFRRINGRFYLASYFFE